MDVGNERIHKSTPGKALGRLESKVHSREFTPVWLGGPCVKCLAVDQQIVIALIPHFTHPLASCFSFLLFRILPQDGFYFNSFCILNYFRY